MAAFAQESTAPAPERPSELRFRWGVNGQAGYFLPAGAVDFGASARFGAQVSDLLGVYGDLGYNAGVGFGGSFSGTGGSVSVSGVGYWHIAAIAEADLGKFFVAGGPLIAGGGWGQVAQGVDSSGNVTQYVVAAGGYMPGLDLKMGITFGDRQTNGRHGGFTLALDAKFLYASVVSVGQSAGSGGASQSVKTGDHIFGITPMLVLGYDAK
jgi:hypothetical protein